MKSIILFLTCIIIFSLFSSLIPQVLLGQETEQKVDQDKYAKAAFQEDPYYWGHSKLELYLSLGVLTFGFFVMLLHFFMWRGRTQVAHWESQYTRTFGLTLVITAGLFLIVAGYSQTQTASMMGLLGTVAGYLLGKGDAKA